MRHSDARKIYHDGRSMTVTQWANELGICAHTIYSRLQNGTPINASFRISKKRINSAMTVLKKINPGSKVRIKIYTVFSRYLKKMKYREIRDTYGMELNKAA